LSFCIDIGTVKSSLFPLLALRRNLSQQLTHALLEVVLHLPSAIHVMYELFYPAAGVLDALHLRKGVEPVGNVGHEGSLVGLGYVANVFHVEQVGNANLFGGDVESELHVSAVIVLVQAVIVDEVGPVDV
jgi:hypothetical protein